MKGGLEVAPQLIEKFWADVERTLVKRHGVGVTQAQTFVRQYRKRLAQLRVGETVYNRGEEQAVETVYDAVKRGGFPPLVLA